MKEYRTRLGIDSEATSQKKSAIDSGNTPGYVLLADMYGLDNDMKVGSGGRLGQSVDQEYNEYVSAVLSAPSVDILKFWEACTFFFSLIVSLLMQFYYYFRSATLPFQRCMLWRWTTFRFKLQLFLAREYSRPVLKPTQGGVIELVHCLWNLCRC